MTLAGRVWFPACEAGLGLKPRELGDLFSSASISVVSLLSSLSRPDCC